MKRSVLAILLNVVVPGTGLILLGRKWFGLGLSVCFALGAEASAVAILFAPASVPVVLKVLAVAATAVAWGIGQFFVLARVRFLADPRLPSELTALRTTAEKALAHGDLETAWCALRIALSMDGSDVSSRVLWARFLTAVGQPRRARRAWRLAARLDRSRQFATQIQQGLAQVEGT